MSKLISLHVEDSEPKTYSPTRTLYLAVIERALLDFRWGWIVCTYGSNTAKSQRPYHCIVSHLPIEYFYSSDFDEICHFAGVDPREVRKANFMPSEKTHAFTPRDVINIRLAQQEYSRRRASER